jgi:hypothetical protein
MIRSFGISDEAMSEQVLQPLDYATPAPSRGVGSHFRPLAVLFALLGITANLALVWLIVPQMHRAAWVHHDLMQNPRAYGREIAPATIAALRQPVRLWASGVILIAAAAFGLLMAINLMCAAIRMGKSAARPFHRLRAYARLKPSAPRQRPWPSCGSVQRTMHFGSPQRVIGRSAAARRRI